MILFNVNLHNVWRKQNSGSNKQSRRVCSHAKVFGFALFSILSVAEREFRRKHVFCRGEKQRTSEIRDDLAFFKGAQKAENLFKVLFLLEILKSLGSTNFLFKSRLHAICLVTVNLGKLGNLRKSQIKLKKSFLYKDFLVNKSFLYSKYF